MTHVDSHGWTFLTNHAHVLLMIWEQPDLRVRDIAALVGVTERAAMRIIHDLQTAGFISIEKFGRQNRYQVDASQPLRHPVERRHTIGELLQALAGEARD